MSVTLYNDAGNKLGLVFPYFETLMYDPVVYITDTSSMGILDADSKAAPLVANTTASVGTRRRAVNAAPALSVSFIGNLLLLLLGVLMLV